MSRRSLHRSALLLPLLLLAFTPALHAGFVITYSDAANTGFFDPTVVGSTTLGAERQAAFQYAVGLWSTWLKNADPVPIPIDAYWGNLGGSILGGTVGSYYIHDNFSATTGAKVIPNVWYQDALANYLHGSDLSSEPWDMQIEFSTGISWNYDYTLTTGHFSGKYDFASVAAHEIGHGMGFYPSFASDGSWGYSGLPFIYDTFLEYSNGTELISSNPATSVTSPTYWDGPSADAANGGKRVLLYSPGTWQNGSSLSHMDDATFPSYLMDHSRASNTAVHTIDPIMTGILYDQGWDTIPEPGTLLLVVPGLVFLILRRRRRG
jgi:hypothetical protein